MGQFIDPGHLPGDARARRRVIVATLIQIAVVTVVLLVLYATVPVPGTSGAGALVAMLAGMAVFAVVVGLQVRAIVRAEYPVARALALVGFALPILLAAFAFTYLSVSDADPASFSEELDRVGAFYFTVTTLATVGFGDISAQSDAARVLVTTQMLFDLALIAGLARLIVLAARVGLHRRMDDPG